MSQATIPRIRVHTKREAVVRALTKLADQLGPGQKLPTVADLCRRLAVSRGTLDHALSTLEQRGVICRRQGSGIYVAGTNVKPHLGIVLGSDPADASLSPTYRLTIEAIRALAAERGEEVDVYVDLTTSYDQPGVALRRLQADAKEHRLRGVLLLCSSGPRQFDWLNRQGVAMVHVGGGLRGWRLSFDREKIVDAGIKALAARGCRRIGMSWTQLFKDLKVQPDAYLSYFRQAIQQVGQEPKPQWLYRWKRWGFKERDSLSPCLEELGYRTAQLILQEPAGERRPDGLVVVDDMLARGLMVGLARGGVAIGRDIQIASMAIRNSPALAPYEDQIIRIGFDPRDMAAESWKMLEALIQGRRPESNPVKVRPYELPS